MRSIHLANVINRAHGAAVIAAWEVDDLDEMWIEAFLGLPTIQQRGAARQAVLNKMAQLRAQHPTYHKVH